MNDKKIPLFCKIRRKICIPRPSLIFLCQLGLKPRNYKKCKQCPKQVYAFKLEVTK